MRPAVLLLVATLSLAAGVSAAPNDSGLARGRHQVPHIHVDIPTAGKMEEVVNLEGLGPKTVKRLRELYYYALNKLRKDLRQEFPDGKIPDEARKQKEKKLVDSFQDRVKELKEGGGKPVTTVERQKAILEGMDSVLCPMAETVENCQRDARRLEGEIRVLEAILEHSPSEQLEKLLLSKRAEVDGLKSVLHRIAETLEGCKRVAMAAKETIELEEQRDDAADEQVTRGRGRPRKTITPTPDAETDNPAQFSVAQKTPFAGMQRFGEAGLLRHLGDNLRDGIGALGIGGVAAGAVEAGRRLLWGTGGVGLPGAGG